MTHIVSGAKTKKELKEKLKAGKASEVYFDDPSIFEGSWSGPASEMITGMTVYCTNHPKRSWYAKVAKTKTGFDVS